jgi:hypothetical protein
MRIVRIAGAVALPLALAGTLVPAQAGAATAGCQSWTGTQPVSLGAQSGLNGVAVLSACNVWAVGSFTDTQGVEHVLTEHWTGAKWTVVSVPEQSGADNFLNSVRAASPTNIWAVGGSIHGGGLSHAKTLILHWDGKHWTRQGTPVPGELSGVRPVSGSEAWAVGSNFVGTAVRPVVLHRTGGTWRGVTIPSVATNEELNGVAATSPADVWVVGVSGNGIASRHARRGVPSSSQPFIVHWNGRTWTHVTAPGTGRLDAVGTGSRTSAMAVGNEQLPDGSIRTLAMRWNGKAWTRVPSQSPGPGQFIDLSGVTVTSQGTAWAVGKVQTTDGDEPLIERWDGSRWTTVQPPGTGGTGALIGVAGTSASTVWAVGYVIPTVTNVRQPLALRCC